MTIKIFEGSKLLLRLRNITITSAVLNVLVGFLGIFFLKDKTIYYQMPFMVCFLLVFVVMLFLGKKIFKDLTND